MTPLLLRSSVRHLLRHPAQLALAILAVALGVAVVLSIDLAVASSRAAFRASAETLAGRTTHEVTGATGTVPDSVFTKIRVRAGVRASAPVVEGYAASPRLPGEALRILGVDPLSEGPMRPYLGAGGGGAEASDEVAGRGSAASGEAVGARGSAASEGLDLAGFLTVPGAALVSRELADRAGLALGDTLPLTVGGRARVAVVTGILDPAGALARQGLRDVLVVDVATAQELLALEGRLSRVELALPPGAAGDTLLARVGEVLPADATLRPVAARAGALEEMIRAFDVNLTALSLLALLFGAFLIYNALTFSVVQRRELLGRLRALGVTRREVFALILAEAAVLGAVGTVLGLGLGVLLGRGMVRLVTRTIQDLYFVVQVDGLAVEPGSLVRAALLGLGATLLSALPPAREATADPPRATLTRSTLEAGARHRARRAATLGVVLLLAGSAALTLPTRSLVVSFGALFVGVLGLALLAPAGTVALMAGLGPVAGRVAGVLGRMAARSVTAALSRTGPAVAALAVAVSVTVALGILIGSFRGSVARWLDRTLQADIYVALPSPVASRVEGTLDPELAGRLAAVPGVEGASRYRSGTLALPEGEVRLLAADLHPRHEAAFELLEGTASEAFPAFRRGEALLVSEPFAFRRRVGVGDTVAVPTPLGTRPFTVAAVFRDYGAERGMVMMDLATYRALWADAAVTSLALFLAPGADAEEVTAAVHVAAGAGQSLVVRTNRTLREASLVVFDRTFAVTAVLRALALVVAFIGVVGALMALQLERGRELAVLRATGLTPAQLWVLITSETGLLGLAAGLLALPAGVALAAVMIHVVNRRSFGWTLEMRIAPEVLAQGLGLAVAGALLAGVYPAWRMSRAPAARALREE